MEHADDECDELMTVNEVARALRVSKMTVYRLVNNGELQAFRISERCLRVPRSAFEEHLKSHETR